MRTTLSFVYLSYNIKRQKINSANYIEIIGLAWDINIYIINPEKKLHFLFDIYLHLIYMSIMENEIKDIDIAI